MPSYALTIQRTVGVAALAAVLSIGGGSREAVAETCLRGPNRQADAGHHWYYRLDRVNNRRCWYQKKFQISGSASESPTTEASPGTGTQQKVSSWISSVVGALGGTNSTPAENVAAAPDAGRGEQAPDSTRHREKTKRKRFVSARTRFRNTQRPASVSSEAPAVPLDADKREALFREFMEWRQRNAVCSFMNSAVNTC
jgi:hypothetical protein